MRHWLKQHPDLDVFHWEWAGWAWSPEKREQYGMPPNDREEILALLKDIGGLTPFTDPPTPGKQRVLVSPQMSMYDTAVNARIMAAVNPNMKIILMTRDPVERAYISWWQASMQTDRPIVHETRPFERAIDDCLQLRPVQDLCQPLQDQYVTAGEYYRIIEDFLTAGLRVHETSATMLSGPDGWHRGKLLEFIGVRDIFTAFPHVHAEGPEMPMRESATADELRWYYDSPAWRQHA